MTQKLEVLLTCPQCGYTVFQHIKDFDEQVFECCRCHERFAPETAACTIRELDKEAAV